MQVKRFLEQANRQLPNLSKNLFVLFNHWDQVVDEDEDSDNDDSDDGVNEQDPEALKKQHCQKVHEFLEQGLEAKAVLDRTFFVSGKEACKAQENEKKGKQLSASTYIFRSVVHVQHFAHKPLSFHNQTMKFHAGCSVYITYPHALRYSFEPISIPHFCLARQKRVLMSFLCCCDSGTQSVHCN